MSKLIEVDIGGRRIRVMVDGNVVRTILSFSTGRPHHRTPTGNHFHISNRDLHHVSSSYPHPHGGAPMPYSQFFAPQVAFHEGSPSVPSHGCVHLSHADAEWLWNFVGDDRHVAVHVLGPPRHHPHHPHAHQ